MEFTEQQISAVARVLSDRAAEDCGVDKDDNWKTYSENYLNDAHVALGAIAAAPQVVADERAAFEAAYLKRYAETHPGQNIDAFTRQGLFYKIGDEYAHCSAEWRFWQARAALAAAPVQAQEPVAYIWSVNGMVKTGGDPAFDSHEKFYSHHAPVQPVAVPDDGLSAGLEEAARACEDFSMHGMAEEIRDLATHPAPAAQGDAKDAELIAVLLKVKNRLQFADKHIDCGEEIAAIDAAIAAKAAS